MAVKVRLGTGSQAPGSGQRPRGGKGTFFERAWRPILLVLLALGLVFAAVFSFYYNKYKTIVDDRLNKGPLFASTAQIYAGPREVRPGQKLAVDAIASELKRAFYNV